MGLYGDHVETYPNYGESNGRKMESEIETEIL